MTEGTIQAEFQAKMAENPFSVGLLMSFQKNSFFFTEMESEYYKSTKKVDASMFWVYPLIPRTIMHTIWCNLYTKLTLK